MPERPRLPPGQQLAAAGKWPLVGECDPAADAGPWIVSIAGLIERPQSWSLDELRQFPRVERTFDIHCVTRWSKFDVPFAGVQLADLLDAAGVLPEARFIAFVARSPREHSTSLRLDEALSLGALVALEAEGRPLAAEHGGPVRVVTPGKYFYKSLKWLKRIDLLADDRLGYWEAEAGYHNGADPWREERFLASTLSRQEMRELLARRNFAGRDLRSLEAAGHALDGLDASAALLRNADFSRASLAGANFRGANLSGAHFVAANLRGACFRDADAEGVDFAGADLREADFRGASLIGASFVSASQAPNAPNATARIDRTTQFDAVRLDDLMPEQADFVRRAIR